MDIDLSFAALSQFFKANDEMLTTLGVIIGGGLALWRYWRDQAWTKKQFAYDYVKTVYDDRKAITALRMLDWGNGEFPEDLAKEFKLSRSQRRWDAKQVGRALRVHDLQSSDPKQGHFTDKEAAIREAFDACLAHFERLGHFMKRRVISKDDFPTTLAYYVHILNEERLRPIHAPLMSYMKRYGFDNACYAFEKLKQTEGRTGMRRDEMIAKVETAYQARRTGDFEALNAVVSPKAQFSYGGEQSFIAAVPAAGAGSVHEAARELFEKIEIRELERVDDVVEGNRVAILWNTTLVAPGGEPFDTQMFDLWEFDESGRICRGTQFLDTAKIVAEMAAG